MSPLNKIITKTIFYCCNKNLRCFSISSQSKGKFKITSEKEKTIISEKDLHLKKPIDPKILTTLQKLSLIDTYDEVTLKKAIALAEQIKSVPTENVEPLYTVLEDIPLRLREDEVTDGNIKEKVLANATILEEEYFVGPPGNIPLDLEELKKYKN